MAKTKKSATDLGRGFDSLIPQNFDSSLLVDEQERVQKLLISDVKPAQQQPRTEFDQETLKELAGSIKQHGILQPLIVRSNGPNDFTIVAGERRWRAAQLAGVEHIPAIVRSLEELEQLEIALVENVQREDLSPLDQAESIQRLLHQFNKTQDEIATRLGKATSTIGNIARLTSLPPDAQAALRSGKISEGHARTILSFKNQPEKQAELLQAIIANGWTVRQAEQFVVASKKGIQTPAVRKRLETTSPATEKVSQHLGKPVSVRRTARGGKLEIGFSSEGELNDLLKKLSKL